jgi:hypothetical protein
MTLQQLSHLKRWHVEHRSGHPVEFHTWDAILTAWLMGWIGMPAALILWSPAGILACVALFAAPSVYVQLRQRLHRQSRLRCDWLDALASVSRARR